MKKTLLVLLFSIVFMLSACTSNEDNSNAPQNVIVESGVFNCDVYDDATMYELEVSSGSETIHLEAPREFDLNYALENGSYSLRVRAILEDGSYSDYTKAVNVSISSSTFRDVLLSEDLHDEDYITIHGRTLYDDTTEAQMLYYTASGIDVEFYGTSLDLVIIADNATSLSKHAYISVVIDEASAPYDGTTYVLTQSEILLHVAEDLEEGFHTVSLYKINESLDNNIGIKRIRTDGFFVDPSDDEDTLKIQYIGASTTTGYGNMVDVATAGKTSENSNGLLAFTSLSAYMLNAEWSITSASGWGVTRGWNTGGRISETNNIPNAFDYTAINSSGEILTTKWNQELFQPDIYVVNLGSNDYNAGGYAYMTTIEQAEFDALFIQEFADFLLKLHSYSPEAKIIVTYGILSKLAVIEDLSLQAMEQAKEEYNQIYALELKTGSELGYPYGANYHPNVLTHIVAAEDLANLISYMTGYDIIHDEIVVPSN